jgi:hypothetical protein
VIDLFFCKLKSVLLLQENNGKNEKMSFFFLASVALWVKLSKLTLVSETKQQIAVGQ